MSTELAVKPLELSPEALQVIERAITTLSTIAGPKPGDQPESREERKRRKQLELAAKQELMDQPREEKQPGFNVNKDVLCGITRELARKFQVPDVVAGRAVMKSYGALQDEYAKQTLTRQSGAMSTLQAVVKDTPVPAVPVYPSLDNDLDNRLSNRASSTMRPPAPGN